MAIHIYTKCIILYGVEVSSVSKAIDSRQNKARLY